MPKQRFSPYIGAGVNFSFFYNAQPNSPLIRSWSLSSGNVHANVGGRGGTYVSAKTWLNPTVVGMGIGYRF